MVLFSSTIRYEVMNLTSSVKDNSDRLAELKKSVQELMEITQVLTQIQLLDHDTLTLVRKYVDAQETTAKEIYRVRILGSLKYDKMRDRSNGLETQLESFEEEQERHGGTFRWIFEPEDDSAIISDNNEQKLMRDEDRDEFSKWLSSPNGGSFRIMEKLGSGKSTLMQCLCNHPSTKTKLGKWDGNLFMSGS